MMRVTFNLWCGVVGTTITLLLGGIDGLLQFLVFVMIADYITGLICGVVGVSEKTTGGKLSSKIMARGIAKKVSILIIVALANMMDVNIFHSSELLRDICIYAFIANESLSLLENAGLLGVPIPKKLKDTIEILSDKYMDDEEMEDDENED